MRAVLALLFLLAAAGCSRATGLFSEPNARAHLSMLAGTIGSRPVGTAANASARAYIVDQLRIYGYEVRVQETDARRPELGRTAHVANIIATLPGTRREAIGLLSHYDSVPGSPGAADDGVGVAVSLEAARVLAARPDRVWSIFVLVTDGEESGLMGAAALATDREVTSRLRAYLNVEAAGSGGPAMLFEAGPGNGWLAGAWSRQAPHPRGGSYGVEIYRRLPNDTDFTVLARQGIPGLNFALIGDGYAYHTARDVPDRVSPLTLREVGENVVATAAALDGMDVTRRTGTAPAYFDVGGVAAVSYSARIGLLLSFAGVLAGMLACMRVVPLAIRLGGALRWLVTALWSAASFAAAAASMAGAAWALRMAREVYHPWYARPGRFLALLLAVGVTAAWTMSRAGRWLPRRAHGVRDPLMTWSLALPAWLLAAMAMLWLAPEAAYLWTLPLLTAAAALLLVPAGNGPALRAVSVLVLAVTATLWLQDTVALLRFLTPLFGRLPVVTPVWVHAALLAAAGLMVAPPFIASVAAENRLTRPSLVTALCLLAVAGTGLAAWHAPAYTHEQPLRRIVRALQEAGASTSTWEVASVEPGLDLGAGAPAGWSPRADTAAATVPWGRLPQPFVFRTTAPALGPPPVEITAMVIQPVAAGVEVAVTVVPRRPGATVSFVAPAGLAPARSSLPGAPRLGQWTATFVAPPADGLVWRASFGSAAAPRAGEIRVVATEAAMTASADQPLPGWLPQDHAVWTASATWVLAAPHAP